MKATIRFAILGAAVLVAPATFAYEQATRCRDDPEERRRMTSRCNVIASGLAALMLAGCAVSGPLTGLWKEHHRRVIDGTTGAGIAGAFVVQKWDETIRDLGGARTTCIHLEAGRTADDGRFDVGEYRGGEPRQLVIYKPGWTERYDVELHDAGVHTLVPFHGTPEERFEELARLSAPLACPLEERRKLAAFDGAIAEEALAIARTPAQRHMVEDTFQVIAESDAYGPEEANRRESQRRLQRAREGGAVRGDQIMTPPAVPGASRRAREGAVR
jgi:hypothetical protein